MNVDTAVLAQCVGVVDATVVLVDGDGVAIHHDESRVAPGAVGDAGFDMDGNRHAVGEGLCDCVLRAHEGAEAQLAERAFKFARGEVGKKDRCRFVDVVGQPGFVEMVAVDVRDVEVGGFLELRKECGVEFVVAREGEPRTKECGFEPRVAEDADTLGVDEHACVADGRDAHGRVVVWCRGVQATGGSVNCWPLRETCSVQAEPFQ